MLFTANLSDMPIEAESRVIIRFQDCDPLMHLMRNEFSKIPNLLSTRTTIVLETVKEQQQLVIPEK